MSHRVVGQKYADVSEEDTASIFRLESKPSMQTKDRKYAGMFDA
jgi:hypothetical protein